MSEVDWNQFDATLKTGNGPFRKSFDKALRQGDPLATGVPFLDHFLEGGLHPGVLNVVAGRTGHGKTLLTRTMLRHNSDKRILYLFADEDKSSVLFDLAASILNRRNFDLKREFRHPSSSMTSIDLEKVVMDEFPNLFIPDEDLLGASIEDVASVVDQAQRMWGEAPDLIVFDFLGCLEIEGGDTSTLGLIHTREHKKLCRMFDESVWLVISQLSRPGATRAEVPRLDRMFGGGEAAIDGCAIGVYRWEDRNEDDNDILLNIMKAKQGRAYPAGQTKKEKAGDNPSRLPYVHTITAGSTIFPKPWPPETTFKAEHPRLTEEEIQYGE